MSCNLVMLAEQDYLQQHQYPQDKQKRVLDVIEGIGFKVCCLCLNIMHTSLHSCW